MATGENGIIQQGYTCSTKEIKEIRNGLRFTPLVCMGLALYGLYIQNPYWHFAIAALGIIPFWLPNHPIDLLYNYGFRHIFGAAKLPQAPLPRRLACLSGGLVNLAIGFSFYAGNIVLAYVFGAMLVSLQLLVITTHFCVASWMYEGFRKIMKSMEAFLSVDEAKKMIKEGAVLLDVRTPQEYASGHIPGAINRPLDDFRNANEFKNKTLILYCRSGMRSGMAKKRLEKQGRTEVYNLGGIGRWN
jgi:rhodanese-related sulfurtransferase